MRRLPFEPTIATPCQESWQTMTGTTSQRHCASCKKTVHNLATLTPRQIEHLVHTSDGNLCARITRRQDGSIETAPQRSSLRGASVLLSASLLSPMLSAQPSGKSAATTITGRVQDQSGAMIPNATVKRVRPDLTEISVHTDSQGFYSLVGPKGKYTFRIEMPGFSSWVQPIVLEGSRESIAPITLQVGMIEMGDIVTIDRRPWYKKAASRTARLLHI